MGFVSSLPKIPVEPAESVDSNSSTERRSLADVVGRTRNVPLESGVIMTARSLGISFGD